MCEFRKETNVDKLTWSQMDNSSEEIAFVIEEKFSSFSELKDKIKEFEKTNFVQLYIRHSRSIEVAAKRAPKKQFNE